MFARLDLLSRRSLLVCTFHVFACLFFFSGCNKDSNRASVSGSVSFNGEPLSEGSIVFIPEGGNSGPSAGGTIHEGKYSIGRKKGPIVGTNRVEINAVRETGKMVTVGMGRGAVEMAERIEVIPAMYNTASELKEDLKPGRNETDFNLTDSDES